MYWSRESRGLACLARCYDRVVFTGIDYVRSHASSAVPFFLDEFSSLPVLATSTRNEGKVTDPVSVMNI